MAFGAQCAPLPAELASASRFFPTVPDNLDSQLSYLALILMAATLALAGLARLTRRFAG